MFSEESGHASIGKNGSQIVQITLLTEKMQNYWLLPRWFFWFLYFYHIAFF